MDNSNQTPSFEIPKSDEKARKSISSQENTHIGNSETTHEILPSPIGSQPLTGAQPQATVSVFASQSAGATPAPLAQSITSDDAHTIAADNDVIEKEWVEKAKKIVALTSNDPFIEAKELSKLKAVYMKKRFNKDLPLAIEKAA